MRQRTLPTVRGMLNVLRRHEEEEERLIDEVCALDIDLTME